MGKKLIALTGFVLLLSLLFLFTGNDVNAANCNCSWYDTIGDCLIDSDLCPSGTTAQITCKPVPSKLCECQCVGSSTGGGGSSGGCDSTKEIETAIGCLNVKHPSSFVQNILTFLIGIAGGIAFLLMIIGAFLVLTSSGNPEKIQSGKELITSAIVGTLMIIFAVFILRVIGMDVLQIFGSF